MCKYIERKENCNCMFTQEADSGCRRHCGMETRGITGFPPTNTTGDPSLASANEVLRLCLTLEAAVEGNNLHLTSWSLKELIWRFFRPVDWFCSVQCNRRRCSNNDPSCEIWSRADSPKFVGSHLGLKCILSTSPVTACDRISLPLSLSLSLYANDVVFSRFDCTDVSIVNLFVCVCWCERAETGGAEWINTRIALQWNKILEIIRKTQCGRMSGRVLQRGPE